MIVSVNELKGRRYEVMVPVRGVFRINVGAQFLRHTGTSSLQEATETLARQPAGSFVQETAVTIIARKR